jgi:hypothetical protein
MSNDKARLLKILKNGGTRVETLGKTQRNAPDEAPTSAPMENSVEQTVQGINKTLLLKIAG